MGLVKIAISVNGLVVESGHKAKNVNASELAQAICALDIKKYELLIELKKLTAKK